MSENKLLVRSPTLNAIEEKSAMNARFLECFLMQCALEV